jgi:hypothetical protein
MASVAVAGAQQRRNGDELVDDGTGLLVIDLGGVDFLDSSTLGVLINVHKRAPAPPARCRLHPWLSGSALRGEPEPRDDIAEARRDGGSPARAEGSR